MTSKVRFEIEYNRDELPDHEDDHLMDWMEVITGEKSFTKANPENPLLFAGGRYEPQRPAGIVINRRVFLERGE